MTVNLLAADERIPTAGLVVAVCTRDLGGAHVIRSAECLAQQGWPHDSGLLIVVNQTDAVSLQAVPSALTNFPVPVWLVGEPSPGFSSVRNRALAAAESAEAVLFLDDDTVVESGWVHEMWNAHRQHPTSVLGSLHDRVEAVPPDQLGVDELAVELRLRGNATLSGSNGLLLPLNLMAGRYFDDRYNESGGEDTDLLLGLALDGHREVTVPCLAIEQDRLLELPWQADVRSAYRSGEIWVLVNRRRGLGVLGIRLRALAGLLPALVSWAAAVTQPKWRRRRCLRKLATRIGVVLG